MKKDNIPNLHTLSREDIIKQFPLPIVKNIFMSSAFIMMLMFIPLVSATANAARDPASQINAHSATLKVMTINIRHNKDYWEERFPMIADEIVRLEPDLIGLQEVLIGIGQSRTLLGLINKRGGPEKGLHYTFYEKLKTGFHAINGEGIAIFSRYPIEKKSSRAINEGRIVLLARVKIGEGLSVDMYNTHLHNRGGDEVRAPQARMIVEMADKLDAGLLTFLTGDMNSSDDSETIHIIEDAGFIDSYKTLHGAEYTEKHGNTSPVSMVKGDFTQDFRNRIDFVFYRLPESNIKVKILDSVVCFNQPNSDALYPSDHLGVMTTYKIDY